MRGEVLARRRRALEYRERADMHVRGLLLLMEKRRVDGAQAVPVALVCHGADSTRHNRLSEAPGNSAGPAARARHHADSARGNRQRPFAGGDDANDARPARRRSTASTRRRPGACSRIRSSSALARRPRLRGSGGAAAPPAAEGGSNRAGRLAQRDRDGARREPGYIVSRHTHQGHRRIRRRQRRVLRHGGGDELARTVKRPRHTTIRSLRRRGESAADARSSRGGPARQQGAARRFAGAAMVLLDSWATGVWAFRARGFRT